jgi:hypothetical protein
LSQIPYFDHLEVYRLNSFYCVVNKERIHVLSIIHTVIAKYSHFSQIRGNTD